MKSFTALIISIGLAAATPVMAETASSSGTSSGPMQSPSSSTGSSAGTSSSPSSMDSNMTNQGTGNSYGTSGDMEMARQRYKAARNNCMNMASSSRAQCMQDAAAMQKNDRSQSVNPAQPSVPSDGSMR